MERLGMRMSCDNQKPFCFKQLPGLVTFVTESLS